MMPEQVKRATSKEVNLRDLVEQLGWHIKEYQHGCDRILYTHPQHDFYLSITTDGREAIRHKK